jgi:hypothetical protein
VIFQKAQAGKPLRNERHTVILRVSSLVVASVLSLLMITTVVPPMVADQSDRAVINAPITLLTSLVGPNFTITQWFGGIPAFEADLSFLRYGMPALLSQIIYMIWVSRSRTLPLFMEATHAVTAFAVSATLRCRDFELLQRSDSTSTAANFRSTQATRGQAVWRWFGQRSG